MIIIGIDPGLSGFISALSEDGKIRSVVIPTVKIKATKKDYDPQAILKVLRHFQSTDTRKPETCLVVLEKQQAMPLLGKKRCLRCKQMPSQGVASSFNIGRGFGLLQGILVGRSIRHIIVHPRTWQAKLLKDVPGDDTKARSILVAQRIFPKVSLLRTERCRKPDHNKADSMLLAYYGQQWLLPDKEN